MAPRFGLPVAGLLCGALLGLTTPLAQAPTPKAGPEHARLDAFAGTWLYEGGMKPSPLGPAGTVTTRETCEWFTGRFHLVCRAEGRGPMGEVDSLGILSWSVDDAVYTHHGIDSMGNTQAGTGMLDGHTWIFTGESKGGGKVTRARSTIKFTGRDTYTHTWEMSVDGGPWTLVMEGNGRRQQ